MDMVCHVGVDVNLAVAYPHYAPMLAFVGGLGLRKADVLVQNIRKSKIGSVDSRKILLERKLIGRNAYINAAGFLRISETTAATEYQIDPLDNSRVHPECYSTYDFAAKIATDALELPASTDSPIEIIRRCMKDSRLTLEKLLLISGLRELSKTDEQLCAQERDNWLGLWKLGGGCPWDKWTLGNRSFVVQGSSLNREKSFMDDVNELKDMLYNLELESYAQAVEKTGLGKRLHQFYQIKDEIRFPWLDVRRLVTPLTDLSSDAMFSLRTGEEFANLHVGMRVTCKVLQVLDNFSTVMELDNGMRGFVPSSEVSDSKQTTGNPLVSPGMLCNAVIIRVNKEKASVELSMRDSLLSKGEDEWFRDRYNDDFMKQWLVQVPTKRNGCGTIAKLDPYFNESLALKSYADAEKLRLQSLKEHSAGDVREASTSGTAPVDKPKPKKMTRLVYHPLFQNCDFKEAVEKLRGRGAGAVIIRPSSKGPNTLSITWAFQDGLCQHIDVEESGKRPGDIGLGKELRIKNIDEPFSDLDEIYSRYIVPMNDNVQAMMNNK